MGRRKALIPKADDGMNIQISITVGDREVSDDGSQQWESPSIRTALIEYYSNNHEGAKSQALKMVEEMLREMLPNK